MKELRMGLKRIEEMMRPIDQKVDKIMQLIGAECDLSDCNNNGYFELLKKIGVIEKYILVKESMKEFEDCVGDFKEACRSKQPEDSEEKDQHDYLGGCKSIQDIENYGDFEYKLEKEAVMCSVCEKKVASYGADLQDDFKGRVQSQKFRSLKMSLKRHLGRGKHPLKLLDSRVREKKEERIMGREKKIGLVLGNVGYYLQNKGRPNSDFTPLVNILAKAGVDVGDINHSSEFLASWSLECSEVVRKRVLQYFNTELAQTGQRPPAKVIADKATWKHETRMVSGLVTVVPDSPNLLQAFFTGSKACPGGTGDEMTESLVQVLDPYVTGNQYLGLAADGATLHCNVGTKLSEHFGKEGHDCYDPLHKAGLVDCHMRGQPGPEFQFLKTITDTISDIYTVFNMGKEFAHFFNVAKQLAEEGVDINFKIPRFFSETRFANYSHLVYSGFVENFPAVMKTLVEVQEAGMGKAPSSHAWKKADKCAGLQILVYSLTFLLCLCAICDIYSHYSRSVNVLQIVNILPHEKFDIFEKECLGKLEEMTSSIEPLDCPCSMAWKVNKPEEKEKADSEKIEDVEGIFQIEDIEDEDNVVMVEDIEEVNGLKETEKPTTSQEGCDMEEDCELAAKVGKTMLIL